MNTLILGTWLMAVFGIPSPSDPPSDPNIAFVSVESPNNPADDNGCGRVGYVYRITKEAIDNEDYVEFLNTVDPNGANSKALYNPRMMLSPRGGITFDPGKAEGSRFAAKPGFAHQPVLFVSWPDAARYANWLNNGGRKGSSTEVGAYNLRSSNGKLADRNRGARYLIPTQDELYKAAFFLPISAGGANTDELYANLTGVNGEPAERGLISLPITDGVAGMLVDPYDVEETQPEWTTNENQGKPTNFTFAGQQNPGIEDDGVSFHLVSMTGDRYADEESADDVEEYAGAPSLSNTGFVPFFPASGSGNGRGGNGVFSPASFNLPPSS